MYLPHSTDIFKWHYPVTMKKLVYEHISYRICTFMCICCREHGTSHNHQCDLTVAVIIIIIIIIIIIFILTCFVLSFLFRSVKKI
jgi:hypothetical protein